MAAVRPSNASLLMVAIRMALSYLSWLVSSSSSLWYKNKVYEVTNSKFSTVSLLAYAPVFFSENNHVLTAEVPLAHLPHSETEIKAIETLFNSENLEVLALYYEHATKESFLDNVADYSIIHLATHGIYNKDHPELSGIILYNNIIRKRTIFQIDISAS